MIQTNYSELEKKRKKKKENKRWSVKYDNFNLI